MKRTTISELVAKETRTQITRSFSLHLGNEKFDDVLNTASSLLISAAFQMKYCLLIPLIMSFSKNTDVYLFCDREKEFYIGKMISNLLDQPTVSISFQQGKKALTSLSNYHITFYESFEDLEEILEEFKYLTNTGVIIIDSVDMEEDDLSTLRTITSQCSEKEMLLIYTTSSHATGWKKIADYLITPRLIEPYSDDHPLFLSEIILNNRIFEDTIECEINPTTYLIEFDIS